MKAITFDEALDIALTQRQIDIATNRGPRKISRKEVESGFLEAFELVGGITRLAIWANDKENYGEFLKLYAKMIPKEVAEEAGQGFVYESLVPQSPLNKAQAIEQIKPEEYDNDL